MSAVTLGAICAALIAAIVSMVGLILSKEQKTSEFRQEWINKLREEIATYVSHVSAIADQVQIKFKDSNEKLKYLAPFYTAINQSSNTIRLRLNAEEPESHCIIEIMDQLEAEFISDSNLFSSKIQELEKRLIKESQKLLKKEWVRVRDGEKTFVYAKKAALWISILLVGVFGFAVYQSNGGAVSPAEDRTVIIQVDSQDGEAKLPTPEPKITSSRAPTVSSVATPKAPSPPKAQTPHP